MPHGCRGSPLPNIYIYTVCLVSLLARAALCQDVRVSTAAGAGSFWWTSLLVESCMGWFVPCSGSHVLYRCATTALRGLQAEVSPGCPGEAHISLLLGRNSRSQALVFVPSLSVFCTGFFPSSCLCSTGGASGVETEAAGQRAAQFIPGHQRVEHTVLQ